VFRGVRGRGGRRHDERIWIRGRFVWGVGDDGLRAWSSDLPRFPHTIQSVLLVGNVSIDVPVGLSAALGWLRSLGRSLLVPIAVPAVVEGLQVFILRGVGSTDDYILNAIGVLTGWSMGVGARRVFAAQV